MMCLVDFFLSVQTPVIDHIVHHTNNEAMTLLFAGLWKLEEEVKLNLVD